MRGTERRTGGEAAMVEAMQAAKTAWTRTGGDLAAADRLVRKVAGAHRLTGRLDCAQALAFERSALQGLRALAQQGRPTPAEVTGRQVA